MHDFRCGLKIPSRMRGVWLLTGVDWYWSIFGELRIYCRRRFAGVRIRD